MSLHVIKASRDHRRRLGLPNYCLTFNGSSTAVDFGSDATLDDLHDAEFTVECWLKATSTTSTIVTKGANAVGWMLFLNGTGVPQSYIYAATTNGSHTANVIGSINDGTWRHLALYFNDAGDRKPRIAVNGTWDTTAPTAAVGAVNTDAAAKMYAGRLSNFAAWWLNGSMRLLRLSNNNRYSYPSNFTPPLITDKPAADANTVELWYLNDNSATVAAQVSANNNGTVANGTWSAL